MPVYNSLEELFNDDTLEGASDYIEFFGSADHVHLIGSDKITGAWAAADHNCRNIIRVFVESGADLEFRARDLSVRQLGLLNPKAMRGMIEAGVVPTSVELSFLMFKSKRESDVPLSKEACLISNIIDEREDFLIDISDDEIIGEFSKETIKRSFSELLNIDIDMDLETLCDGIYAEIKESFIKLYKQMSDIGQKSLGIINLLSEDLDKIVTRNFSGYRKNKKWLLERLKKSCEEGAIVCAPIFGTFEDDPDILLALEVLFSRYPIKERVTGFGNVLPSRISGGEFEREIAAVLEGAGFVVERVGATGDQGADVLATKDGLRFAIQCKDHGKPVGNASVQQALSAKAHYVTDYAIVCASNGFTKSAKALAATANVLLLPPHMMPELMSLRFMVE